MSNMYSNGNNINKTKKLQYNAILLNTNNTLNASSIFPQKNKFICSCESQIIEIQNYENYSLDVGTGVSINTLPNMSKALRVSNILKNYTSYGQFQYANASLENRRNVNYLGKTEGQKGGSGAPPKNRLR